MIETFHFPLPPTFNPTLILARRDRLASLGQKRFWNEEIARYCQKKHQFQCKDMYKYIEDVRSVWLA